MAVKEDVIEMGRKLGEGAFGAVYMAKYKNMDVAVKLIEIKNEEQLSVIRNEARIIARLSKYPECVKHIICYHDLFISTFLKRETAFIITDYFDGNPLSDYLAFFEHTDKSTLLKILLQIAITFNDIHLKGVVHRDIKPENILFNEGLMDIYIIDFGLACILDRCNVKRVKGTPLYIAPEVLFKKVTNPKELISADVYSIGLTFYYILNKGDYPYDIYKVKSIKEFADVIVNNEPTKSNSGYSDVDNIIMNLIKKDPKERYTLNGTIRLLSESYAQITK